MHLYIKRLFCEKKGPNVHLAGRLKLYIELENSDKRHRNSVVSGGIYNTISHNSSTEKHPRASQIKSGRKDSSTEGNSRDVEQESHCRDPK